MKDAVTKMLTVQNLLGALILSAWLAMKALKFETDASLDNVIMIVVGFIFGSSDGSKVKDKPPAAR